MLSQMLIPAPSFRLQQSHGTKRPSQDGEEDLRFSFLWTPANRRDCSSDLTRLGLRPILTNGAGPAATPEDSLKEAYSLVPTGRRLHVHETPPEQHFLVRFAAVLLVALRGGSTLLPHRFSPHSPDNALSFGVAWAIQI